MPMVIGEQVAIRAVLMRGGTSKGLFIMADELPSEPSQRDRVLLALYGSPDLRQIDGVGGADPLTSKVAIIGPSTHPEADVDYTFGQVSITQALVDYKGNCGNISAGVGPFVIDEGLVKAVEPVTTIRIHQTNTKSIIVTRVPVRNCRAAVDGDYHIDGAPGSGAKIELDFADTAGAVTGDLLPSGLPTDTYQVDAVGEVELSVVDAGNPVVFLRAQRLGLKGSESPQEIEDNPQLMEKLERIRGVVAQKLGLVERWQDSAVQSPYVPFTALVSSPQVYDTYPFAGGRLVQEEDVDLVSRILFMQQVHKTYPLTGTICTGAAARIPGTVVNSVCRPLREESDLVRIGHPAGVIEVRARVDPQVLRLEQASVGRTARRIMEGVAYVPRHIYNRV